MSVVTYKCPNCGASLVFDPESGMFACDYCLSKFSQEEFSQSAQPEEEEVYENPEVSENGSEESAAMLYHCPNCGAEIITDETTAATFCFYCHHPLVLSGRLEGKYLPDGIITFQYTKEQAIAKFQQWIQGKKFIKKGFYSPNQVEKMTGVYFPYWLYSCETDNHITGTSKHVTVTRVGDLEHTETKVYQISRSASVDFRYVPRNALTKAQSDLLKGIFPFEFGAMKKFRMEFLAGFQAEKRDVEKEGIRQGIRQNVAAHAKTRMKNTVSSQQQFSLSNQICNIEKEQFHYVMLPVWILTYKDVLGKQYYFAMNGQTGEVAGKLPVNKLKINLFTAAVFFGVFILALMLFGGGVA